MDVERWKMFQIVVDSVLQNVFGSMLLFAGMLACFRLLKKGVPHWTFLLGLFIVLVIIRSLLELV
jgi:mannose/fructose/N-acetylgalactosamine-specific phosphotransferase system component IID